MTTVAPSSTHRLAVAKPIPVPAAAVITTTLPVRSPCPGGGTGEGRGSGTVPPGTVSVMGYVPLGSGGRPRTRSPMMFFWISLEPP